MNVSKANEAWSETCCLHTMQEAFHHSKPAGLQLQLATFCVKPLETFRAYAPRTAPAYASRADIQAAFNMLWNKERVLQPYHHKCHHLQAIYEALFFQSNRHAHCSCWASLGGGRNLSVHVEDSLPNAKSPQAVTQINKSCIPSSHVLKLQFNRFSCWTSYAYVAK